MNKAIIKRIASTKFSSSGGSSTRVGKALVLVSGEINAKMHISCVFLLSLVTTGRIFGAVHLPLIFRGRCKAVGDAADNNIDFGELGTLLISK